MTTRDAIHRIIDELPDGELGDVQLYLDYLRSGRDPLLLALLNAPEDDEPTTPEEDAGASEAREQYRRGDYITAEQAKRELFG